MAVDSNSVSKSTLVFGLNICIVVSFGVGAAAQADLTIRDGSGNKSVTIPSFSTSSSTVKKLTEVVLCIGASGICSTDEAIASVIYTPIKCEYKERLSRTSNLKIYF